MSPIEERQAAKSPANWLRRLLLIALVAYWSTLFTATHAPIDPHVVVPGNDKTLHVIGYAGLGLLLGLVLAIHSSLCPRYGGEGASAPSGSESVLRFSFFRALIVLAIYAVFDELTQLLVGRTCDLYDWFADCAGIVIGLTAAAALLRLLSARSASKGV